MRGLPILPCTCWSAHAHMDKLLENAQTYSEVLKRCGSSEVSDWKAEDLERAFHWADYFRKVHGRIVQKHSLVQSFDDQLKEVGRQLCMRFGREEFSCGFLGHSADYLVKALLENPALPGNLREKILQDHASDPVHKQHLKDFTATSTLLETLSSIHTRLTESQAAAESTESELHVIDAMCLQEDISWQLKDTSSQRLTDSVQKRLSSLAQQQNGLEVILLAVTLSEDPSSSHCHSQPQVQGAILKWLLQQAVPGPTSISACNMWEQDSKLLATVSKCHLEFFKVHIQYLVQEMDRFEVSVSAGEFTEDNAQSQEQKFEKIVSHFRELASHKGCVREVCTSLIESRMPETEKFGFGTDLQDVWTKLHLRLNL